jgi:hypothetical protein
LSIKALPTKTIRESVAATRSANKLLAKNNANAIKANFFIKIYVFYINVAKVIKSYDKYKK